MEYIEEKENKKHCEEVFECIVEDLDDSLIQNPGKADIYVFDGQTRSEAQKLAEKQARVIKFEELSKTEEEIENEKLAKEEEKKLEIHNKKAIERAKQKAAEKAKIYLGKSQNKDEAINLLKTAEQQEKERISKMYPTPKKFDCKELPDFGEKTSVDLRQRQTKELQIEDETLVFWNNMAGTSKEEPLDYKFKCELQSAIEKKLKERHKNLEVTWESKLGKMKLNNCPTIFKIPKLIEASKCIAETFGKEEANNIIANMISKRISSLFL